MKGQVALVCERGVRFAVVAVRPSVISGVKRERDEAVRAFSAKLGVPAVLMAQGSRGVPIYDGRPDLVEVLAGLCADQLPWREFTMQAA
jgi:hypothetical protein